LRTKNIIREKERTMKRLVAALAAALALSTTSATAQTVR
jgi:hypothetical protein